MSELARALEKRRVWNSSRIEPPTASSDHSGQQPVLYLGPGRDAANLSDLLAVNVSHILNCADDVENFHDGRFIYKNLMIADFGQDKGSARTFRDAAEFCRGAAAGSDGDDCIAGVVLIHCANGTNRSPTVAVAVVMQLWGLSLREAWTIVKRARPAVLPMSDNREQLLLFERELYGVEENSIRGDEFL